MKRRRGGEEEEKGEEEERREEEEREEGRVGRERQTVGIENDEESLPRLPILFYSMYLP